MKIILDANILMAIAQFKVDVFEQLKGNKLFTITPVIEELKKLSNKKGKNAVAAKVALQLVKKKRLKVLISNQKADAALVSYSTRGYRIATQDKVLQKKLKELGMEVIYLRQKRYLDIK